jgi:hypothetical protein
MKHQGVEGKRKLRFKVARRERKSRGRSLLGALSSGAEAHIVL